RKLTCMSTLIYILFIFAATSFALSKAHIADQFEVNSAVLGWMESKSFSTNPVTRTWKDIHDVGDLRKFLLYALPNVVSPSVQHANFPVSDIRFTLRRMTQVENTDKRFNGLMPKTWSNKAGISSLSREDTYDDKSAFGSYREWGTNSRQSQGPVPNLGLQWCAQEKSTCNGGAYLDSITFDDMPRSKVEHYCNNWCLELDMHGKSCSCWTLSGKFKCTLYYFPEAALVPLSDADLDSQCFEQEENQENIVIPKILWPSPGNTAHFPLMKRFTYNNNHGGYSKTPGFVMRLKYWTQDMVDEAVRKAQGNQFGYPSALLLASNVFYYQMRDWLDGNFLSPSSTSLVVDFVTYNPNYEVFTWVQLLCTMEPSGRVAKQMIVSSIVIKEAMLQGIKKGGDRMLANLAAEDILYALLVLYYVMSELWEFATTGPTKYFSSAWQLLASTSLLLHVAVLALRYSYLQNSFFSAQLATASGDFQPDLELFELQAIAAKDYFRILSLMLLVLYVQLVRYLSDIFPRIEIILDVLSRSITPVLFLVLIILDVFIGFVIWSNLMYGKSVGSFRDVTDSINACTEMLFGRIETYKELSIVFPISGFVFYSLFMVFFYFILQNFTKAIVLCSYADASKSYEDRIEEEKARRAAEEDQGQDQIIKAWKNIMYACRKFIGKPSRSKEVIRYGLNREIPGGGGKLQMVIYIVFLIFYTLLSATILDVPTGYRLRDSVISAFTTPNYVTSNSFAHEVDYSKTFNDITTREDVQAWLVQALPQALFNSSSGAYDGGENPLKTYESALPERFSQIVINDWNILIGQQPVRLSVKYRAMAEPKLESVSNLLRLPSMEPVADKYITSADDILHDRTREVVNEYCSYANAEGATAQTEKNGFACMLSVDYQKTANILLDMNRRSIISDQASELALEFVAYNGNMDSFLYSNIKFTFSLSGRVETTIQSGTVQLKMYEGCAERPSKRQEGITDRSPTRTSGAEGFVPPYFRGSLQFP
ncbi:unnamed protein product, partial [Polarella glacialis]